MIIVYSRTGNSLECGEMLAKLLGHTLLEVRTTKKLTLFSALLATLLSKYPKIVNVPQTDDEDVYFCGPIWAGSLSMPLMGTLSEMDLTGKRVSFALTQAGTMSDDELKRVTDNVSRIVWKRGGIMGKIQAFSTGSKKFDLNILKEHLADVFVE